MMLYESFKGFFNDEVQMHRAFEKMLMKWNNSKLVKFQYVTCGRINIIFRLYIKIHSKYSSVILRIGVLTEGEFRQAEGREVYLKDLLNKHKFNNIPHIFFLDSEKDVIPFTYSIMEEIKGETLSGNSLEDTFYEAGKILASLHKISTNSFGKDPLKDDSISSNEYYINYFNDVIKFLYRYNKEMSKSFEVVFNKYYSSKLYSNKKPILLHHDFHAQNILVNEDGSIYLIDWDSARGGIKELDFIKFKYLNLIRFNKNQIHCFFKGYTSLEEINIDINYYIYELSWLSRMFIFESKFPVLNKYFPEKEFYLCKFNKLISFVDRSFYNNSINSLDEYVNTLI
jgi:thiamine kinase-like enzyme